MLGVFSLALHAHLVSPRPRCGPVHLSSSPSSPHLAEALEEVEGVLCEWGEPARAWASSVDKMLINSARSKSSDRGSGSCWHLPEAVA